MIEDVAKNYNAIYEGKNNTYTLAKTNGKPVIAFVTVKKGDDGVFYSIGSGFVARKNYLDNKSRLWESANLNQPKLPNAVSGQQPGKQGFDLSRVPNRTEPWSAPPQEASKPGENRIPQPTESSSAEQVWANQTPAERQAALVAVGQTEPAANLSKRQWKYLPKSVKVALAESKVSTPTAEVAARQKAAEVKPAADPQQVKALEQRILDQIWADTPIRQDLEPVLKKQFMV